ncbi:related to Mitochondrial homologous recombination protein 1 [Saccharomycodes ludwigii]|uniref:Large ribosomal subunit protein mL67 n=1 Tax=Saccharomycodes ludwigii TaxID=36035 RepID=A0A376B3V8_9ASCO|nr:hypothetical protein SCDLUD_004617 [Saccharomycodes ludwigii]KAH3899187.1 hypothetical protein SCDLUD_004617 [Saccharomycodes ludwigii]SSD59357.1 related to Mitochondrial homologous recombination protein 1 [Saccharomycodes ludwigii]
MSISRNSSSRFRTAKWLSKAGFAPQVFLFRNLESGQVCYSQLPTINPALVSRLQFKQPNWQNRVPSFNRRDIWKIMCVVTMPSYDLSIKVFQNLNRLRYLRDVVQKKTANEYRKKNEWGQIWYSGNFRPTYSQEAVADLRESILKSGLVEQKDATSTVHWEDEWRMGDVNKYWTSVLPQVKHEVINKQRNCSREESVILKQLGDWALNSMKKSSTNSNSDNNKDGNTSNYATTNSN